MMDILLLLMEKANDGKDMTLVCFMALICGNMRVWLLLHCRDGRLLRLVSSYGILSMPTGLPSNERSV